MSQIRGEAILFDMYYFTKAPTLAQTNGVVEIPSVDSGTPSFRKFYISNLVCDGANRAMLIRGLPEMSIKDIYLKNVTIKSQIGADIIEASNISLKNVTLDCAKNNPVINIENSHDITLEHVRSKNIPDLFISIKGNRSKEIKLIDSNLLDAKTPTEFKYGADKSDLVISK